MLVAGIDFSSIAVDIVLVDIDDRDPPSWKTFYLSGADAFERTRSIAASIPHRRSKFWDDILAIGIEEPTGKFKPGLGYRVQGAVLSMLPPEVLVKPWPPSAWRKAVGLPGGCSKDTVRTFAYPLLPHPRHPNGDYEYISNDVCDAYCIALATRQAITREQAA